MSLVGGRVTSAPRMGCAGTPSAPPSAGMDSPQKPRTGAD